MPKKFSDIPSEAPVELSSLAGRIRVSKPDRTASPSTPISIPRSSSTDWTNSSLGGPVALSQRRAESTASNTSTPPVLVSGRIEEVLGGVEHFPLGRRQGREGERPDVDVVLQVVNPELAVRNVVGVIQNIEFPVAVVVQGTWAVVVILVNVLRAITAEAPLVLAAVEDARSARHAVDEPGEVLVARLDPGLAAVVCRIGINAERQHRAACDGLARRSATNRCPRQVPSGHP